MVFCLGNRKSLEKVLICDVFLNITHIIQLVFNTQRGFWLISLDFSLVFDQDNYKDLLEIVITSMILFILFQLSEESTIPLMNILTHLVWLNLVFFLVYLVIFFLNYKLHIHGMRLSLIASLCWCYFLFSFILRTHDRSGAAEVFTNDVQKILS